ncbi:tetratricopeptide repeat protein [Variovorax sp. J22P271]|uniref:tetratricopeptide repeat protein n=1 Tax=Variovorax davisae TaxID=3053515 RepID=UPI0025774B02|nr:tetratricopeptide repeat protein [Variovorax sp. J22P271]MDM0032829.1 tetratricopeptide repeat protein [Variovorax sp. J22P271]
MTDDAISLEAFRKLLETSTASNSADSPVILTDSLVGSRAGAVLRRCAVPHEFDRALLQQLGECDQVEAEALYAQFAELSIIQINEGALCLHERWRRLLWNWWLDAAQRHEFAALSEKLVGWFAAAAEQGDPAAIRRRAFHLVGCRREEGLRAFDTLFRQARHGRQVSECSLLIRMVHEYDPLLQPRERAKLLYDEGKLASDMLDWERSIALLHAVADDASADPVLRLAAEVRVGHALHKAGRVSEGLTVLERARAMIADRVDASRLMWRVLYELGETYRDQGRNDAAAATLLGALERARKEPGEADVAGILNSLGTVQLKMRDVDMAIHSFQTSLNLLAQHGDAVRSGAALNNLALAQLERCDWFAAEASLSESLKSKRAAGDVLGQATALLNLSRAQAAQDRVDDAIKSAERAIDLFQSLSDFRGQARAHLAVARLFRRSGRWPESMSLLQMSVAEASVANDEATAAAAHAEIARKESPRGMRWWVWLLIALLLAYFVGVIMFVALD